MTDSLAARLLGCPYCGEVPEQVSCIDGNRDSYCVSCDGEDCPVQPVSRFYNSEAEALAAWNTRLERAASAWVKVSERLPEPDTWVLVHNGKWTGVGMHCSDSDYSHHDDKCERWQDEHREFIELLGPKVTHWLPISPPEEP